jgi:phosphopantetheinyl transferase (holo-ACP synthase)
MIGNDLVDLRCVQYSDGVRTSRWVEKVFTEEEKLLIEEAPEPMSLSWRMWSMKESAYKANLRRAYLEHEVHQAELDHSVPKRSFGPKLLKCSIINERLGMVLIDDEVYETVSEQDGHLIHSCATTLDQPFIKSDIILLSGRDRERRHRYIREAFLRRCSIEMGLKPSSFDIKKNEIGMPILYVDGIKSPLSFSFSYHGQSGAFALMIPQ